MKRGEWTRSQALWAGLLLCLAVLTTGCEPDAATSTSARTGRWQGQTEFGTFSFTVCASGRRITGYMLEYTTGGQTQALGGDIELLVGEEGDFDLGAPEAGVAFSGRFSADGRRASGLWEITGPGGETVSEEWSVVR